MSIVLLLSVVHFVVWLLIIANVSHHFGRWLVFQWTLYKHPEDGVCCCGSHIVDHSAWDNHSPKTQKEWYIESNKPKFN
ncbi:hypothetical protein KKJFFJLC_00021 [Vibrio phage vB_VpaS_PGB]|nr:hypothetical protein HHKILHMN_00013 [Vibrio phage vB_VpaS_PGA]WVH05564.1 hypothetical protein KKJFFJLC_00021 [Vibrio phage vB_VpaS_PGB]